MYVCVRVRVCAHALSVVHLYIKDQCVLCAALTSVCTCAITHSAERAESKSEMLWMLRAREPAELPPRVTHWNSCFNLDIVLASTSRKLKLKWFSALLYWHRINLAPVWFPSDLQLLVFDSLLPSCLFASCPMCATPCSWFDVIMQEIHTVHTSRLTIAIL